MRADLPCCSFKNCRYCFDGNCRNPIECERCEFMEQEKIVELFHSYRHICGDTPPDRLQELVEADQNGKCLILTQEIVSSILVGANAIVCNGASSKHGLLIDVFGKCGGPFTMSYENAYKILEGIGAASLMRKPVSDIDITQTDVAPVVRQCKPGDTVYQADTERIYALEVKKIIYDCGPVAFDEDAIGKTVFLTCEDAMAALKGENDG